MKAVITIEDDDEPGKISAAVIYEPTMTDRSGAHRIAAAFMRRMSDHASGIFTTPPGGTDVKPERIAETLGQSDVGNLSKVLSQPTTDDAYVAIGSTRFSDGQIQTPDSLERARARLTL